MPITQCILYSSYLIIYHHLLSYSFRVHDGLSIVCSSFIFSFHRWCQHPFCLSSLSAIKFQTTCWIADVPVFISNHIPHISNHADVPVFISNHVPHTPCWCFCFVLAFLFLPSPHSICGAVIHQSVALLTLQQARFCLSLSRGEGLVIFSQLQKDLENFTYAKYLIGQINF